MTFTSHMKLLLSTSHSVRCKKRASGGGGGANRDIPPIVELVLQPAESRGGRHVAQTVHDHCGHAHGKGAQARGHRPQHHRALRCLQCKQAVLVLNYVIRSF